jgi:hypothetical protein
VFAAGGAGNLWIEPGNEGPQHQLHPYLEDALLQRKTKEKARQPETKVGAIAHTWHKARVCNVKRSRIKNPHEGRKTSINNLSRGPGKTVHRGTARGDIPGRCTCVGWYMCRWGVSSRHQAFFCLEEILLQRTTEYVLLISAPAVSSSIRCTCLNCDVWTCETPRLCLSPGLPTGLAMVLRCLCATFTR